MSSKRLPINIELETLLALLIVLGGMLTAFTISDLVELPNERLLVKALGVILLVAAMSITISRKSELQLDIHESIIIWLVIAFYVFLFFSDILSPFGIFEITFSNLLRIFASILLLFLLFNEKNSTKIINTAIFFGVLIALLSIVYLVLDIGRGEKFPIIGVYSRKSIIFEQNVFGILCYLTLIMTLFFSKISGLSKLITLAILLIAIILSFYRTVWILSFLILFYYFWKTSAFLRLVTIVLFYMGTVLFISNFETINEVLKLEQLATLTGRTDLWQAAAVGIKEYPIFGTGESSVRYFTSVYGPRLFTTYHNVFVDIVAMTGGVGLTIYLMIIALLFLHTKNKIILLFVWAPALSNTFFIFSPNPLGLLSGIMTIILINKEIVIGNRS